MNAVLKMVGLVGMIAGAVAFGFPRLASADFLVRGTTEIYDDTDYNIEKPRHQSLVRYTIENLPDSTSDIGGFTLTRNLPQLGAENIQDLSEWHYVEHNSELDYTRLIRCDDYILPGESLTVEYTIDTDRIMGWENVGTIVIPTKESEEPYINALAMLSVPIVTTSTNNTPCSWYVENFGVQDITPIEANALDSQDPDGDGFDNLFEYITDTNPSDTDSSMQMVLAPASRGGITVSVFPLSERAVYDVYGARNPKKPLEYVGSFTSEDGGLILRGKEKKKIFELDARMRRAVRY